MSQKSIISLPLISLAVLAQPFYAMEPNTKEVQKVDWERAMIETLSPQINIPALLKLLSDGANPGMLIDEKYHCERYSMRPSYDWIYADKYKSEGKHPFLFELISRLRYRQWCIPPTESSESIITMVIGHMVNNRAKARTLMCCLFKTRKEHAGADLLYRYAKDLLKKHVLAILYHENKHDENHIPYNKYQGAPRSTKCWS